MYHHAPRPGAPADWALLRIWPHDGAVGSPRPMNASVVSVNTAVANVSTAWATMRFTTLGRMWRRMIQPPPDPMTRARSTNIRSLSDRTWLRTTRAVVAQLVRPMTITITSSVARMPNSSAWAPMTSRMIGARISARTIVGSTRKKSEIRIRSVSTVPPTKPATIPTSAPMHDRDDRRHQPDQHRDPGAVDGEVEHVAAELVGAEQVLGARRLERRAGRRGDGSRAGRRTATGTARAAPNTDEDRDADDAVRPAEQPAREPARPARAAIGGAARSPRSVDASTPDWTLMRAPAGRGSRRRCRRRSWRARPTPR